MGLHTTGEALLAADLPKIEIEQFADSNTWPYGHQSMCVELFNVKFKE